MVDDYRLTREAQLQLAEGVFRQDEDYRATTFKQWLQAFEWDSTRERHERDTDQQAVVVPAPRTGDRDRLTATDDDVAEAERIEQLTRWHTDDHPVDADAAAVERAADDVADFYCRSA
ncbi:hypothetical protein ACU61A_27240 [Pseudonocardia sichuanensis]